MRNCSFLWTCKFLDIYKGEKFYHARSRTQMKFYCDHSNSRLPHEVLSVAVCDINANMCYVCASDCKTEELNVGRSFSVCNGFGPAMKYTEPPMVMYVRLYDLRF